MCERHRADSGEREVVREVPGISPQVQGRRSQEDRLAVAPANALGGRKQTRPAASHWNCVVQPEGVQSVLKVPPLRKQGQEERQLLGLPDAQCHQPLNQDVPGPRMDAY